MYHLDNLDENFWTSLVHPLVYTTLFAAPYLEKIMSRKKKKLIAKYQHSRRDKRIVFHLNEAEFDALNAYCKRYHIKNRSQFIRKTVLGKVSQTFCEDYPTLF